MSQLSIEFDRPMSRHLGEEGMRMALENAGSEWAADILAEARDWFAVRSGQRVTMEQFRQDARNKPASHKAWGSLPKLLCKAKVIAPIAHPDGSAVYTPAGSLRTHGHPVRVWLVL